MTCTTRWTLLAAAFVLLLGQAGCLVSTATSEKGRAVAATDVEKIQPGVTTKAQVLESLGEPHETSRTVDDETYTYRYTRQSHTTILFLLHSEASRECSLSIVFGADGVVRQVTRR